MMANITVPNMPGKEVPLAELRQIRPEQIPVVPECLGRKREGRIKRETVVGLAITENSREPETGAMNNNARRDSVGCIVDRLIKPREEPRQMCRWALGARNVRVNRRRQQCHDNQPATDLQAHPESPHMPVHKRGKLAKHRNEGLKGWPTESNTCPPASVSEVVPIGLLLGKSRGISD